MGATNANGGYIQKKSFNPLVVQKEKGEKSVSSLERWRRPCGCQRGGRRRSDYPRVVLAEAEAEDDCAKVVHEYYQLLNERPETVFEEGDRGKDEELDEKLFLFGVTHVKETMDEGVVSSCGDRGKERPASHK